MKAMRVHEEKITIRFADADPAGVVFYPRAIALAHSVVEDLIRHSPLGWEEWFASPTHAAPLRHAEADFLRPMKPGEIFTARAAVESTGTTSVTFLVEILDPADRVAARIRTVHVLIDKKSGTPIPLTGEILSALA
jgi:acyl-CoA thioesterase FadM